MAYVMSVREVLACKTGSPVGFDHSSTDENYDRENMARETGRSFCLWYYLKTLFRRLVRLWNHSYWRTWKFGSLIKIQQNSVSMLLFRFMQVCGLPHHVPTVFCQNIQ